jgi:hypothetical protein
MICIEYVKHAAENCGFKDLVKVAKEAQQAVRDAAKEHADGLSNCFDLRYGQFIEELEELDHLPDTEKPVCFLKGLLRRKRDEANTTAGVKPDA